MHQLDHAPGLLEGVTELGAAKRRGEGVVADGNVFLGVISHDGALE